jgi:hypothetical protein
VLALVQVQVLLWVLALVQVQALVLALTLALAQASQQVQEQVLPWVLVLVLPAPCLLRSRTASQTFCRGQQSPQHRMKACGLVEPKACGWMHYMGGVCVSRGGGKVCWASAHG